MSPSKNMKKIFTFILSLFTLLNSEASWYPQFQYGIMPCMVGITLYDASGSLVFTFNPAIPPYPPPTSCQNINPPSYAIFNITGVTPFRVDLASSAVVNLPCLGGLNHIFTFTQSTPGPHCDTTYYINY